MDPNTQQPMQPQPVTYVQPASTGRKPIVIVVYILGAVMAIFVVLALLLSGSTSDEVLSRLSAQQTEIARVAELGVKDDSASPATRNLASTIKITSTSAVNELTALGAVPTELEISEFTDETADSLLESAKQTNEFNDTFSQIMTSLLDNALASINGIDTASLEEDEKALVEGLSTSYQSLTEAIDS